jgi:hypothetical protein
MKYYVYELIDPKDNKTFYVGKGSNKRCYYHLSLAKHNRHYNKKLENKIWNIWNNNNQVIINIIFRSNNEIKTYNKEYELITNYGLTNLCNLEAGDRHRFGNFKHSQETKDKIKLKNIERFKNPKEKEKISLGTIKRFENPKERLRISKLTKKGMTKEVRKKISNSKKGKPAHNNKKIEIICIICGNRKLLSPAHAKTQKCCSAKCGFEKRKIDKWQQHVPQESKKVEDYNKE